MSKLIKIRNIILTAAICGLWAGQAFCAGITIGSGATVMLSGSPVISTVDLTITGALSVDAGTINVSGNWDNNATFTAGSSTITLDGTTSATFEAGSSTYNNIEINKTSATGANDNVTFQTNTATINGTLTITDGELVQEVAVATGAVTLSDASSKWTNITDNANVTLSGNVSNTGTITFDAPTSDLIQIRSNASPTQRNWQGLGGAYAFNMRDVDVKDQTCTGGTPATITVTDGTDLGNNVNWVFGNGESIAGTVYLDEGNNVIDENCNIVIYIYYTSGSTATQTAAVVGGVGTYDFSNLDLDADDIATLYIDNQASGYKGCTTYRSDANGANDVHIYKDHVIIHSDSGFMTNANMANVDDNVDNDIKFDVTGGTLTVEDNFECYIWENGTFQAGGIVIVDDIDIRGTFTMGANAVTVSGSWFTSATGAFTSTGTVTFDSGAAGEEVTSDGESFNNVDFNDAGSWTLQDTTDIDNDLNISNGTLNCGANNINIDSDLIFAAAGTLNANTSNITIGHDFANFAGGIFNCNTGTVAFDDNGQTSTIYGSNIFNDLECTQAGKQINFTSTTTQTVNNTLTLTGATGNLIKLRSTATPAKWDITFPNGAQTVSYVDAKDSDANTNTVTCYNSTNSGNNNANWLFNAVDIDVPAAGSTTGRRSTIMGTVGAGDVVTIRGTVGAVAFQTVATTTADANGNYRISQSDYTAVLDAGANNIRADVGAVQGVAVAITVSGAPTTSEIPTITSPAEGGFVKGNKPTISGKGEPGAAVILTANDENGNLLLTNVATATVDGNGDWTISSTDYTTALAKGINYLTVTVGGVTASNVRTATFVDPFGIVFDSITDNPIANATVTIFNSNGTQCTPGVDIAGTDSNPQTTGADGAYSFLCANGNYYITVDAAAYTYPSIRTSFPAGRTIITGSKGEVFTVAGAVIEMDHPMDANTLLLKIKKDANKKKVVVGDVVTYTVTIKNETASDVTNVYLEDKIPAGFKYITGKAILDNTQIADPAGNRPIVFDIGTVNAGATRTLKYQLVVGSGATLGNYENTASAKYSDGTVISNQANETVEIIPDSLFDLGTVIGKVFWDRNENGIQDLPQGIDGQVIVEEPIPNVQIATEDGTLITTDKDGKYHLPAIIPGRHLLRVDERTLPQGAYLTTDKVVIVDITPGILSKVNFGVTSDKSYPDTLIPLRAQAGTGTLLGTSGHRQVTSKMQAPFVITQEREKPIPRLNASLFNDELIIEDGKLVEPAIFRIFTNYSLFIKKWKLEILDKDTKALAKKFEGTRLTTNKPIYWNGEDKKGKSLNPERNYVYVLTVTGKDGRQDVTKEKEFKIKNEKLKITTQDTKQETGEKKQEWIQRESKVNNLDKQNIRIEGETVKVTSAKSYPYTLTGTGTLWGTSGHRQVTSIRILKGENLEGEILPIQQKELLPSDVLESTQRDLEKSQSEVATDIILPKGEYDIEIIDEPVNQLTGEPVSDLTDYQPANGQADQQANRQTAQQIYTQHIKVGEDYLFFVAMGDVKAGYTFHRGSIEPIQHDDKYREGFWSEGKLAYYLKGKIKGKYLITSSLDTERDKKELFRNLDPDKYYPVYGDASTINYDATNTQGMLYLLIEWDKSSVLWGNYDTGFTDTEFAQFSRTLYGGKIHYETVSATRFGEPVTKLIVFRARAQQRAAHNEFVGTGGSLFYLKHSKIIEGSEKLKIEVRDKITGLVLAEKELEEEFDYEIDYSNGRLTFWQPVSYMLESDSIISSHLLDGNPVYVAVDYEYETKDKYDEGAYGVRAQQSLTDYLRVGGTYVKEEQLEKNYELRAADTILHLGEDIKFTGEYAESESEQVGSFISTDGGLTFTELSTGDLDKGKAYGIKGEVYLFDKLGLTSYYKKIEKGFSSASTTSQQGKELLGAGLTLDITPKTRLRATYDIQKLIDDGNPQTQLQMGARKTETSSAQITHQMEKLRLTGEYRHQEVTEKKEQFESETNTEEDTVAVRADYKLTEKIALSLKQQATLKGSPNHQTTAGVTAEVNEYLSLRAMETVGTKGTAASVGATANVKDRLELSSDYTRTNYKTGGVSDTISLGGKAKVDDKTEVHTTLAVTDSSKGGQTQSVVFGGKRKISEELELTTDRTYAKSRDKLTRANTFGLVREKDGRRLEGTFAEQQSRSDAETSNTNIFGLSGDINDKWAAQGSFERGRVQSHDGTLSTRNAGSIGLGFVDKDKETGKVRLKASSKLELRMDDGEADKRQYLVYNAIEGKINPNTTLFAKANISQTKNTTTDSTEAQYKELVTGAAYRPVNFDRLNLLAKYTYLEDDSPSGQSNFSDIEKEKSHILAGEAVYDLTDKWQLVEKLAYKQGEEKVTGFDFTKTQTWLMVHRLNYKIDKDWQVGAEYRRLTQKQAEDYKQGALIEVSRNIGEFIQVGAGYNFTDFNDDLTHLDYTAQGPFIRLTGKFYDRTPEEIERARQRWLEKKLKQWAWELVQDELAKPDSPVMQELHRYYYFAKKFEDEGKLNQAKECYQRSLQIGRMMYAEAEEYVRGRIEIEKKLKKDNQLALEYYHQGRLLEAKQLWQKIKQEAEPELISMEVQR